MTTHDGNGSIVSPPLPGRGAVFSVFNLAEIKGIVKVLLHHLSTHRPEILVQIAPTCYQNLPILGKKHKLSKYRLTLNPSSEAVSARL